MGASTQNYIILQQLLETWDEITRRLAQDPSTLFKNQFNYWQDYTNLYANLAPSPAANAMPFFDNRFKHADWQKNLVFNFIKQTYLLLTQHLNSLINDIAKGDARLARKLWFFTRQFLDAMAPTNFANTNPEVLATITETQGKNLLQGLKQFLEDLQNGEGVLKIKMTDLNLFELGKNIALTPGKVVFQNDIMQLIQYKPATKKIYSRPLLIIPPWINKYYILDLQAENSFVKWAVAQGFTVFLISWVNANSTHQQKQFADYMQQGALAAIRIMQKITRKTAVNVMGYCIGGTLLGCTLAYLAAHAKKYIKSATFLTTLFDFSEPGELGAFIDEKQITQIEAMMQSKGYMEGAAMASVFNALRANDLVWSAFVNNYLKGQQPKAFDLLFWNADSTNIPASVHSFYLRNMYLYNHLMQPNKIKLAGTPINLSKITIPSYFLAAQDDHLVPWTSCYNSQKLLRGPIKFVLTGSGHVAGVVNPPCKNKYGYWTNNLLPEAAEDFLAGAIFHHGSWWNDWSQWLQKQAGELCSATSANYAAQKSLEVAPGSYVKVRLP